MAKTFSALDFKSATLVALRAVLYTDDTAELIQALDERMRDAGAFYEDEPVILDAQELDQAPDWKALIAALRRHDLHPIGVQAAAELLASAHKAGLAPLEVSTGRPSAGSPAASSSTRSGPEDTTASPAGSAGGQASGTVRDASDAAATRQTLVIRHPLRSGQRIYARGSDLIVIGMVSQGAEVIADGHIHVYGPLRGKAMAGARGDAQAMILTTQLDAELLAIAGVYRVVETQLPKSVHNQPAQVVLDGDTLRILPLNGPGGH